MFKKAKYRAIPCLFDEFTGEIKGTNWLFNKLIDLNVWFDFQILQLDELPIWVEVDNEDPDQNNYDNEKRRQQLNDAADIAITVILLLALVVVALLLNKYSIINIF